MWFGLKGLTEDLNRRGLFLLCIIIIIMEYIRQYETIATVLIFVRWEEHSAAHVKFRRN